MRPEGVPGLVRGRGLHKPGQGTVAGLVDTVEQAAPIVTDVVTPITSLVDQVAGNNSVLTPVSNILHGLLG